MDESSRKRQVTENCSVSDNDDDDDEGGNIGVCDGDDDDDYSGVTMVMMVSWVFFSTAPDTVSYTHAIFCVW